MGRDLSLQSSSLDAEAAYQLALGLLQDHAAKHTEMLADREIVRQRTTPQEVLPDKYLITSRSALGWAITAQMRSFFSRATRQIEVMRDKQTRTEDRRTSKNERWLLGSSSMVNRQNAFVESNALYFGMETGEAILGASFNPLLAKQGKFPIEVMAPDPTCCAYSRSHHGLTYFVMSEIRSADAIADELMPLAKRGGKVLLPKILDSHLYSPSEVVEDMRLYTKTHEMRWIDGEFIYSRRHFAERVPFDIAYFYDVPSDRPEEMSRAIISPVRDILQAHQQLIDLFVTDAELGARPTGILVHGNGKFEIVQLSVGEIYQADMESPATNLIPITLNPNQALLQQLSALMMEQIDTAAMPRSTFTGPAFQLSGFALEKYSAGIDARVEDLKQYPEMMLGSHMGLRLKIVRRMATREMAKSISPDDPDLYLSSFAVADAAEMPSEKGQRKRVHVWNIISADDVSDDPVVNVVINPNIPARNSQRLQQLQIALQTLPYEYAARTVYEPEDADELLGQHEIDVLLEKNPDFAEFYYAWMAKKVIARDKDMAKEYEAWTAAKDELDAAKMVDSTATQGAGQPMNPAMLPAGAMPQGPAPSDPAMPAAMQGAPQGGPPPMDPQTAMALMQMQSQPQSQSQNGGMPAPVQDGRFGDDLPPMSPQEYEMFLAMVGQQGGAPVIQ